MDGRQTYRSNDPDKTGKSIDEVDKQSQSSTHEIYRQSAKSWFEKRGWTFSENHIGMGGHEGVYRMADFAVEKGGAIKLIECLTDWTKKWGFLEKLELSRFCPVWFVHGQRKCRTVSCLGYHSVLIKSIDLGYKKPIYLATMSVKQNQQLQKELVHVKKKLVPGVRGFQSMLSINSRYTRHIRNMD